MSLTYWISVSRIERVESSVKHPELPGSSHSVHRLWNWESKHSGKLQRRSVSHAESSIDLDCSLAPARSFSGCVWWLRTGSRRRPVSGHLWVCARSAPTLVWRQSKHTSFGHFYIAARENTHVWNGPIKSGSGMESGSCAATSCFKVATLYPPGGTSPGIISGKVKVDLGWSTSFKDSCQSVADISTLWIKGGIRFKGKRT